MSIAARVPDHKKLAPWRFVVLRGEARSRFGTKLAAIWAQREPDSSADRLETERRRFLRAPVIVAVVFSPKPHPGAPEWEQILSSGCVCFNLLNAAAAHGFAANWITEWCAYDPAVTAVLGLRADERISGFIYIGTGAEKPAERDRPDVASITAFWDAE